MATTVTAATLTVNISESITLNGTTYDQTVTKAISSVGNVSKSIFNVIANGSSTVAEFAATPTGTVLFDSDDLKYIRVTNLDDTNPIIVNFASESNETAALELPAGASAVMFEDELAGNATGAAETGTSVITDIFVHNAHASETVDVEVVIATA